MDQGAVTSRFVDFTAVLRVYNVEILGLRFQCGVGVLGGGLKGVFRLEVLVGEEGSSFCCPAEVWFCGSRFYEYTVCGFLGKSSTITTTAASTTTATTTATAERFFEALRVYGSSTTTTTATSTATTTTTATTDRLFEALLVYWLVFPSTFRGFR